MKKLYLSIAIIILYSALTTVVAISAPIEDLTEHRYTTTIVRNTDGTIHRSQTVLSAFRKAHPCPSTGLTSGSCSGWAIDHVIPLAVCGRDAVDNLQWLPDTIKSCAGTQCKDRWERKVYQCPKSVGK